MGGLLSHPRSQGQPAPSRRPLGLQPGGPRHLAPAGGGVGSWRGSCLPPPLPPPPSWSATLNSPALPARLSSAGCQPKFRHRWGEGRSSDARPLGWAPPAPSAGQSPPSPPRPGLGAACQLSALATPGSSPGGDGGGGGRWGGGGGGEEERASEGEAFKIPLWRDKHRSHFKQVFQLSAWRLSPIPVTGTDSFLIHLCHPPQHS